jgi:hypothetical protein
MGLSVFPLAPREKRPPTQFRWESFQHTLPTEEQLKSWFADTDYNIAIATGAVSRLLAFDIDGATAKSRADEVLEKNIRHDTRDALSDTILASTGGGGLHLLVRFNPDDFLPHQNQADEIKNAVLWRGKDGHSEIRLKGDGGYIVAIPSTHPSGNPYTLLRGSSIAELSKDQILDLIRSFRQIDGRSERPVTEEKAVKHSSAVSNQGLSKPATTLDEERILDVIVILKQHYLIGQRHDFTLFLAGWLRKEGIALESAKKIVEGLAGDDEELRDRLATLEGTYQKESLSDVKGFSGLLELLQAQLGSAEVAQQVLKEVEYIFPRKAVKNDNGQKNTAQVGGSKAPTASELAIDIVDRKAVLYFKDEYGSPHLQVKVGDHTETMQIGSYRFELYVSKIFYDEMDRQVLKAESLHEVIRIVTARTVFDGITARLHLRAAWSAADNNQPDYNTLYYDPATENWSCIKITPSGWEILARHPDNVLFTRFKQLPQATPVRDYPADIMDKYLDIMHIKGHAARLLVKVLLIGSFIPDIGHPITVPNGEQGGVKSTYCRYHKRLVDPCAVELLTIPKDRNEFVQHMHHNLVVVYDNVRIVPKWFSDEICKAVTGAGNSKRKLYTDDEDVAYNYKRCILVNGINNVLTEPDALDRSVMLDLVRISDEKRREEAEVDAEFEAMKPALLGYIFDILAKALSIKPSVKLERKPRMAGFAAWGEAIARAMGCKDEEFLASYYSVLERQNVDAVEATLVGPAIVNFVGSWPPECTHWEGTPDQLLDALRKIAEAFRIDTRDGMWPKKGNSLTRRLKPLLPDLRQGYQIDITITRDTKGENTKSKNSTWIAIRKISPRPPTSPPSPRTSTDDGGGLSPSTMPNSPPLKEESDAQDSGGGGGGDGGDTVHAVEAESQGAASIREALSADSYAAFDLEWTTDDSGNSAIYAAAFVDNRGNSRVLHVSDFKNSEQRLLQAVLGELERHPVSLGWYTTGIATWTAAHDVGAAEYP